MIGFLGALTYGFIMASAAGVEAATWAAIWEGVKIAGSVVALLGAIGGATSVLMWLKIRTVQSVESLADLTATVKAVQSAQIRLEVQGARHNQYLLDNHKLLENN